jgi:hypothetical protein
MPRARQGPADVRKFFQTEWLGIRFDSFSTPDSRLIAGDAFYAAFYEKLFAQYSEWNELDPAWRASKKAIADFIAGRLPRSGAVLSIGCGNGFVEKCLLDADAGLEVTETSGTPLRWLARHLPDTSIHVGRFPECLPAERRYSLVYMSAVDYCMGREEWVALLAQVQARLAEGGRCLVVSPSVETPRSVVQMAKDAAKALLEFAGLRHRGQLWGYLRTPQDHIDAFRAAGMQDLEQGTVGGSLWIEGKK